MSITKLTSVKILIELYKRFKTISIEDDFSLQKLVNRSMDKYVEDEDFKDEINKYDRLSVSGSGF
jgi:hypothetical protein